MRRILRENALCALLAGAGCAITGWLGLYGIGWNDYEVEARPAFTALAHGHVLIFLRLVPAYGGSLVERAPFALIPGLWGGGAIAVYRTVALPCLLATAALAVWLCARMRSEGRSTLARALTVWICVANPVALSALELGHPEELLGACLCVAAVILAARGRPVSAGVALGLAIANKEWALLALGPVLLALPTRPGANRRQLRALAHKPIVRALAAAVAVSALILAPLVLVSSGGFVAGARDVAVPAGALFQPWQVWWFLGWHGALVHGLFGEPLPGYRTGPSWTGTISHPLIIAVGVGVSAALWLQRRHQHRAIGERSAMLLLALVLLLRCMLDTWNIGYYALPFMIALLAWEARGAYRPPIIVLAGVLLPWFVLQELSARHISPDLQSVLYLAWAVPLAGGLAMRLFSSRQAAPTRERTPGGEHDRAQETTVSALGRLVSTS
jgi:Glycosyltransferase family 87